MLVRRHLEAAQSQLSVTKAKLAHDQSLYDYSKITAPFAGVVTSATPISVRWCRREPVRARRPCRWCSYREDDLFRLVIPVPESYVRYIHIGDPVEVRRAFAEPDFSREGGALLGRRDRIDRTMHTEVDVPNPPSTAAWPVCGRQL